MFNFKQYCYSPFFKIFILLFYVSTISSAFSQTDSLATKSYEDLTTLYIKNMDESPEIATIYIKAAYKLVEAEKDTTKMVQILFTIVSNNLKLSQNEKALQNIEEAIPLASQSNNTKFLFALYNLKGNIYNDTGEFLKALDAYMKSREYAVEDNNTINEIQAAVNIGFIKKMNQDYEEAISIFKESLELIKQMDLDSTHEKHYKRFLYINLADTFLRMKETSDSDFYIKEAEYYNDLGFQVCSKTENTDSYYTLLINKAIIYFEKEQYSESIKLATDIKEYALKVGDTALLGTMYFYLGKNYYFLERYTDAAENLANFYEIVQKSEKEYSNERQLHGLLALSYFKIGDNKKSKFHSKEHERLLKEERKENIKVVTTIHTKNDLPEITEKLHEISDAFKKEERKKKWLYGISGFLIILLTVSILFYRLKVKRIKINVAEVLRKVAILEQQQQESHKTVAVSSISEKITDTKAALILEKLADFEVNEQYLSLDCSLSFVAEKLESNTSYVSNVINNYKNKTFKSYITELRINTALIRLKNDAKLRSYTIKAIAEEFGFKRQETFSKAFKTQTGIYPSQYLKKLREDLEID